MHFRRTIIGNIGSYDLTKQQVSLFRKRLRDNDNLEEVEVTSQKKWKYTTTEDQAILSYITTNKEYAKVGSEKLWKAIEKEKVVEGRGWQSMMNRFPKIMENVESYDLTEEQISSLKKKLVVKEREEEMMDMGEKDEEEDNLAMGMDETEDDEEMEDVVREVYTEDEEEVDDPGEEGESDGMSEDEDEMEGGNDLHGEEEMEDDNFRKYEGEEIEEENSEDEDDDDDEEGEPHKAYILVDF